MLWYIRGSRALSLEALHPSEYEKYPSKLVIKYSYSRIPLLV